MQFLANENFPLGSVTRLRKAGYNITAITEDSPGVKDREVLKRATIEDRIVLTFDRDYGELIYRRGLSIPAGVVYFRFTPTSPDEPAEYLFKLQRIKGFEFRGMFTVVEAERVRQRPLPPKG
ncbi:DUF5615 family PIN-like protein [candidate division WOR-3 bacterium]|nr:DUF5615 family PIN-like protein [candidate division WOR-3 bacterium]